MAIITEDKTVEAPAPACQSNTRGDRDDVLPPSHGESGDSVQGKESVSSEETFEDAFSQEDLQKVSRGNSRNHFSNCLMNLIAPCFPGLYTHVRESDDRAVASLKSWHAW